MTCHPLAPVDALAVRRRLEAQAAPLRAAVYSRPEGELPHLYRRLQQIECAIVGTLIQERRRG